MKRLNVYVDGFNLYFGIVEAGFNNLKWLDIHALAENIKGATHTLNVAKYFTSRINNNPNKQKRQNIYLDALGTTPVSIHYGQFRSHSMRCSRCAHIWNDSKEKMTDVNIATSLLIDAFSDAYDVAFLISGDSDLVPPIKAIRERFPQKEIWVVFPPKRDSNALKKVASNSFALGKGKLRRSQLAESITTRSGTILTRPIEWT